MRKSAILIAFVAAVLAGLLAWGIKYLSAGLPSLTTLEDQRPSLASKVYSADGVLLHEFFLNQRRTYIPIEEMPPFMWQAVVGVEDRRFFKHWGLDPIRNVKALLVNVLALDIVEGASTLTQQLARQLYMNESLQQTLTRKLREQVTAVQIERTYTKREILDIYLNYMNFGHGSYGVYSASRAYYGKNARDLKLEECALLAGLLQRPAALSPYVNPERAMRRRNVVLRGMQMAGYISEAVFDSVKALPLGTLKERPKSQSGLAPYFVEYIRQDLGKRYGNDLYQAGMKIYTTLDSRVQYFADSLTQHQVQIAQRDNNLRLQKDEEELEKFFTPALLAELGKTLEEVQRDTALCDSILTEKNPVQTALISLNPRNGHIMAMVGGRDFTNYKFNRAVQAERQPGSAFKPFLYTAAIDNGYPPSHELLNQPVVVMLEDGKRWSPHNYGETMGGLTTIRDGLRRSLNLISVRMIQEVTNPTVVRKYAQQMGISTHIPAVDAIALGSGSVIPIEITAAYCAFANQGVRMDPIAITRVEDQYGNVIEQNAPRGKEVLSKETAFVMTDLLRSVLDGGAGSTGGSARWKYKFYRPAAGKTGTTNDYTDAWFVGFSPQIATGVWFGFDNPAQTFGEGRTGSNVALPVWAPFMRAAHDTLDLPREDFIMPDGVVRLKICRESKLLATPDSRDVYEELFITKYAPTQYCDDTPRVPNRTRRRRRIR